MEFTIVIVSFKSFHLVEKHIKNIDQKNKIIVIENSQNTKLKKELEEKYHNVKVIIPPNNIGFCSGYNLGIKESKTDYVFLNPSDIELSNQCLTDLEECVTKIKDLPDAFKNLEVPKYLQLNPEEINNKKEKWIDEWLNAS